jgi:hypothetical protein
MNTINETSSHGHPDLHQIYLQILECPKETWWGPEASSDHGKPDHSSFLTGLESLTFPEKVASMGAQNSN